MNYNHFLTPCQYIQDEKRHKNGRYKPFGLYLPITNLCFTILVFYLFVGSTLTWPVSLLHLGHCATKISPSSGYGFCFIIILCLSPHSRHSQKYCLICHHLAVKKQISYFSFIPSLNASPTLPDTL